MPLQFPTGIVREHLHTRSSVGLFDVSHMGQIRLTGNLAALERLCPIDVASLSPGRQRYCVLTNDAGGILDDLMVMRIGDHLVLIVNAACKHDDAGHLRRHLAGDCIVEELEDRALIALQGPTAATVLSRLIDGPADLSFMTGAWFTIASTDCLVTRSGYTGEDGFEISVPADEAEGVARALLAHPEVAPIGLGARDTLRLEAGLCLYGHDIDATTSPVEADVAWVIARARREGPRQGGFPGAAVILAQLRDGVRRRRVGLRSEGKIPVREGAVIVNPDGLNVGVVTSGSFGPTLERPIAMGYIDTTAIAAGVGLSTQIRGKRVALDRATLPFVAHRYYRG
jgi:aminomethyltransferase